MSFIYFNAFYSKDFSFENEIETQVVTRIKAMEDIEDVFIQRIEKEESPEDEFLPFIIRVEVQMKKLTKEKAEGIISQISGLEIEGIGDIDIIDIEVSLEDSTKTLNSKDLVNQAKNFQIGISATESK